MKRVVITGAGTINALGHSVSDTLQAMREGRCGIQLLSMEQGREAWFDKPLTCWIHPIVILPVNRDAAKDGGELVRAGALAPDESNLAVGHAEVSTHALLL